METRAELAESSGCLCLASRRAARSITRDFDRVLRPHGVRATQFSVLAMLALGGPKSIGALAAGLGLERSTLSRNLRPMEERGWVRIRAGEDARLRHVEITKKGEAAVMGALPAWRAQQATIARRIGDTSANALRRLALKAA